MKLATNPEERGYRAFLVEVEIPTTPAPLRYKYRAKPHHIFSAAEMEGYLDALVEDLDKRFEHWNFRRVDVGANKFKFIYDGLREGKKDGPDNAPQ